MEPDLFPKGGAPDAPKQADAPRRNVGAPSPALQRLNESVNETASRLAVLEERLVNLRKKAQLTEQALLGYEKETRADLKALDGTLTEMSRKVSEVKETIDTMAGELSSVVRKPEFQVLERYLDLWQPLSFVTREEAKLLVKEAVERHNI